MDFFDLHCDTAYEMYLKNEGFYENNLAVSAKLGECFENWTQTFAIWIKEDTKQPFLFYKNVLSHLKRSLCGKVTPIFAVEGGSVIEDKIDRLYELKKDGIKFLTLTWNNENLIAGGVNSEKGLSAFGKDVITQMNKIAMAVDVSHLNDKSFYDVIEIADRVLATHSNCRSICGNKRNLTDCQIKLLAQKGGIIGLNFYPPFLGDSFYDDIYRNIYHLCEMGLENNISIGSDFDGAVMPQKIKNISKIPDLYAKLLEMGLKKDLLYKIFYKNAFDFTTNL